MKDQTEIRMTDRAENEILILRKVLPSDLDEVAQYRAEFLASGDSMDGCSNLRKYDDLAEWYRWIKKVEQKETCPAPWVPDTQYLSIRRSDGRLIGTPERLCHDAAETGEGHLPEYGYAEAPDLLPQRQSCFGQDHPVEWRRSGK